MINLIFFPYHHNLKSMVKKKKTIVYDLDDFICKCGSNQLEKTEIPKITPKRELKGYFKKTRNLESSDSSFNLHCSYCGRTYLVKKRVKRMRISNLPMSFGFRSMYWEEINIERDGLSGKLEEYYEIEEIKTEK